MKPRTHKARGKPGGKKRKRRWRSITDPNEHRNPVGRQPIYRDEYPALAKKLCEWGATDQDLAEAFEVSVGSIRNWRRTKPAFSEAVRVGGDKVDDAVERTLLERALGYTYDSEKIFCSRTGTVIRADTLEHVPPDIKALQMWLWARRREKWRPPADDDEEDDGVLEIRVKGGLGSGETTSKKKRRS